MASHASATTMRLATLVLLVTHAVLAVDLSLIPNGKKEVAIRGKLTRTKDDSEIIPIGRVKSYEPINMDIGVRGWGTGHSLSMAIAQDWYQPNKDGAGDKSITAVLLDNKLGSHDHSEYLKLKHRSPSPGSIDYYLEILPEYVPCNGNQGCLGSDHWVDVYISSGPSFVPGNDAQFPAYDDTKTYFEADIVHTMDDDSALTSYTYQFTTDKTDVEYIPIGVADVIDGVTVDLGFRGYNTHHGIMMDIVGDWIQPDDVTPEKKYTAFLKHNINNPYDTDLEPYIDILYRRVEGGLTYLYVAVQGSFHKCGNNENCKKADHHVVVSVIGNDQFKLGNTDEGKDTSVTTQAEWTKAIQDGKYASAQLIDLNVQPAKQYRVDWTQDKGDDEFIPLGVVSVKTSASFDIEMSGWGVTHSFHMVLATDWFHANFKNEANKVSAYIFDNSPTDDDYKDKISILYRQVANHTESVFVYLKAHDNIHNCDGNQACIDASHYTKVTPYASRDYVSGSDAQGRDGDFDESTYFPSIKVAMSDVGDIPEMKDNIDKLTKDLQAVSDLHISDVKNLTKQLETANGIIADLEGRLAKLETWMMQSIDKDTPQVASCSGDECGTQVSSDGANLQLSGSQGSVKFNSKYCATTDLCDIVQDVEALKKKLAP